MNLDKMTAQELYDLCMKEYNSKNPIAQYMINNFYRNIETLIRQHLCDGDSLFEIGCGAGESSERISKMINPDHAFTVSDYDSRYVEMIRRYRPSLHVIQSDVYALHTLERQYDWVIVLEVLEHLKEFEKALDEIFRLSRKYVLISAPNEPIWKILNILRFKYWTDHGNTLGHVNHWSSSQLISLLSRYGTLISIKKPIPWTIVLLAKKMEKSFE
jgi:ubiquinone/menaquinone biosynthesis C-methylase UbiE